MTDLTAEIETMEHRLMRAWVKRDRPALKSLASGNFHLLVGSRPAVLLDRPSWLEAVSRRFICDGYRFGDIYVRKVGPLALFATQVELDSRLDGEDWSGKFWVTDIWQKGRFRRSWRIAERVLSRIEENADVPSAVRSMQLWR